MRDTQASQTDRPDGEQADSARPGQAIERIERLRPKVLDLSANNGLIGTTFSERRHTHIRIVDELPASLVKRLSSGTMLLDPLPDLETAPPDEDTPEFRTALSEFYATDEDYQQSLEALEDEMLSDAEHEEELGRIERALRDRVRAHLGLPARQDDSARAPNLAAHARLHGIRPDYELPAPDESNSDGRHDDDHIQTLMLADRLERRCNSLISRCNAFEQERGIHVLHCAVGFLEWQDGESERIFLSPLLLLGADLVKRKTRHGYQYRVSGADRELVGNLALAYRLRSKNGIDLPLPAEDKADVEGYLAEIDGLSPRGMRRWRVRRYAAIGAFPSVSQAMFEDIDPARWPIDEDSLVTRAFAGAGNGRGPSVFSPDHDIDDPQVERDIPLTVLDADASQLCALVDIARNHDLALEGPPGTGKSQTIVNAIAGALASGKKVLFVAEKLAALEVVRSRLEERGLGEFVLSLQSSRNDPAALKASIEARFAMPSAEDLPSGAPHLDNAMGTFRETRAQLARYIALLAEPFFDTGLTNHQVLGRAIVAREQTDALPRPLRRLRLPGAEHMSEDDIAHLCQDVERYANLIASQGEVDAGWRFARVSRLDPFATDRLLDAALSLAEAHPQYASARRAIAALGLDTGAGAPQAGALARTLNELSDTLCACRADALSMLLDSELRAAYDDFERQLARRTALDTQVDALDPAARGEATAQRLGAAASALERYSLTRIDAACIESERTRKSDEQAVAESHLAAVDALVGEDEAFDHLPARALRAMTDVALDTEPKTLLERPPVPLAAAQIAAAEALHERLTYLRKDIEALTRVFDWESIGTREQMLAHLHAIRDRNRLSGEHRRARKAIRAMMVNPRSYRRADIAERIFALTVVQRDIERMRADPRWAGMAWFRGLDTPIDSLYRQARLQRAGQDISARMECPAAGAMLATLDADVLMRLRERADAESPGTLRDERRSRLELQVAVEAARAERAERATALSSLVTLQAELGLSDEQAQVAGHDQLRQWRDAIWGKARIETALAQNEAVQALLGEAFAGPDTPVGLLGREADAAKRLSALPGNAGRVAANALATGNLQTLIDAASHWDAVATRYQAGIDRLAELADNPPGDWGFDPFADSAGDLFLRLGEDRRGLDAHAERNAQHLALGKTPAAALIDAADTGDIEPSRLSSTLAALIDQSRAEALYRRHGAVLADFRGETLDRLRARLAECDRRIIELSRRRVRRRIAEAAAPPPGNNGRRVGDKTEMALIDHALGNKRGMSARKLTSRAGNALRELKPCWMMSPLAVSSYLPRELALFDLVVIDEGSQMRPENALGAMLRARQALVVGDTRQLPPTPFFKNFDIGDDEEDALDDNPEESILNVANLALGEHRRLRWHYRSRDGSLIAYSNLRMYDNELLVFPSPRDHDPRLGVSLVRVADATYRKSVNMREAEVMLEHALRHMAEDPGRSLGVVVMNSHQQALLESLYQAALETDPVAQRFDEQWLRRDDGIQRFFIKNLENVQGDERDVIFVGTVYGPDPDTGKVYRRFSSINGQTGERRLNVLFSRAREKLVTFTSMSASDLRAGGTPNRGVDMLAGWLEYAATGRLHAGTRTERGTDSPFEDHVIRAIRGMGFDADPQIGVAGYFIDIGVRHANYPDGYLMGVECDGASYHSGSCARERDRLRQEVLEDKGWALHRIWSTDWFSDPLGQSEKLRRVLHERLSALAAPDSEPG